VPKPIKAACLIAQLKVFKVDRLGLGGLKKIFLTIFSVIYSQASLTSLILSKNLSLILTTKGKIQESTTLICPWIKLCLSLQQRNRT